jgi:hypothetical protein
MTLEEHEPRSLVLLSLVLPSVSLVLLYRETVMR